MVASEYIFNMTIFGRRCNNNVEFFHNIKRLSVHPAGGVKSYSHERVGWGVHVFHLRIPTRVRVRKLRGQEKAFTQRGLQTRRESGHPGE